MTNQQNTTRPPIITVMGHIDHGKSTLLDTIRDTHVTDSEAGGITQHVSAYEVTYTDSEDHERKMTFLDTPGHEAFAGSRERGAALADIAVLVIAVDDGVQPQTLEALKAIREAQMPYVIAFNKMDKNGADAEKVKQDLLQHEVYLEQFGGSVTAVEISAKEGTGIDQLMEMLALVTDMEELTADLNASAEGVILESSRDPKRGAAATLIITNGTLTKGGAVATASAFAPVRIMEDFKGNQIEDATVSSPVNIVGWNALPLAGERWRTFQSKKEAEKYVDENRVERGVDASYIGDPDAAHTIIPVILKADSTSGLEGLRHETEKHLNEKIAIKIIRSAIGNITENDALFAMTTDNAIIAGFNVSIDEAAQTVADREDLETATFSVIYDAAEWIADVVEKHTPMLETEETTGEAKILKHFSQTKNKQVIGGTVQSGELKRDESVIIKRRDAEISRGRISNLQHQKSDVAKVEEGMEFGAEIDSKREIQPGDIIEAFEVVER